jgi:hypothetical protein
MNDALGVGAGHACFKHATLPDPAESLPDPVCNFRFARAVDVGRPL